MANPYLIMAGIGTAVSVLGSLSAAKAAKDKQHFKEGIRNNKLKELN